MSCTLYLLYHKLVGFLLHMLLPHFLGELQNMLSFNVLVSKG